MTSSADTGVRSIDLFGVDTGTYTFTDNTVTLGNGTSSQKVSFGSVLVDGKVADGTTTVLNFDQLGVKIVLAGVGAKGADGSFADGDLDGHTVVVVDEAGSSFQLGSDAVPADTLKYDIRDMTAGGSVIDLSHAGVATLQSARTAIGQIGRGNRTNGRRARIRGCGSEPTPVQARLHRKFDRIPPRFRVDNSRRRLRLRDLETGAK